MRAMQRENFSRVTSKKYLTLPLARRRQKIAVAKLQQLFFGKRVSRGTFKQITEAGGEVENTLPLIVVVYNVPVAIYDALF